MEYPTQSHDSHTSSTHPFYTIPKESMPISQSYMERSPSNLMIQTSHPPTLRQPSKTQNRGPYRVFIHSFQIHYRSNIDLCNTLYIDILQNSLKRIYKAGVYVGIVIIQPIHRFSYNHRIIHLALPSQTQIPTSLLSISSLSSHFPFSSPPNPQTFPPTLDSEFLCLHQSTLVYPPILQIPLSPFDFSSQDSEFLCL